MTALHAGDVVRVRGEGGAIIEGYEVPDPATFQGDWFAQKMRAGTLTIVDDKGDALAPQPEPPSVPEEDAVDEAQTDEPAKPARGRKPNADADAETVDAETVDAETD